MTKVEAEGRPAPLIDTAALARMLGDPSVRLFDCTTHLTPKSDNSGQNVTSGRADYLKGHIPSAAFIDLAQELSDTSSPHRFSVLGPEAFAAAAGRLGIGDGTRVILYDGGYNAWAARVWWTLKGYGFDNASVLDGGIIKWRDEGRPLATDPTVYPSATFTARPRPGFFADKARVAAAIDAPDVRIVNALTSDQHAGKGGVHYGRAGRIPGSCNVASRGLLDPKTNALLPIDELRRRFDDAGLLGEKRVIAYCGGGIAASLTALALAALGKNDVEVYIHSLQEWANDPSLPMEVG
ncbi:MAG: rhodanese-like domain-containing protein [Hyphomicrobiaceae bacterium]